MARVDRRGPPCDAGRSDDRPIDFKDWLRTMPMRERQVALKLASGETTSGVARLFQITADRVSQLRRELFVWQGDVN